MIDTRHLGAQDLGTGVIATAEEPGELGSVINWRGVNYVPQAEPDEVTPEMVMLCDIRESQLRTEKLVSDLIEEVRPILVEIKPTLDALMASPLLRMMTGGKKR